MQCVIDGRVRRAGRWRQLYPRPLARCLLYQARRLCKAAPTLPVDSQLGVRPPCLPTRGNHILAICVVSMQPHLVIKTASVKASV